MYAESRSRLLVDGGQCRQTLCQIAWVYSKRCARSLGYTCRYTSKAGCRQEAGLAGSKQATGAAGAGCRQDGTPVGAVPAHQTQLGLFVNRRQYRSALRQLNCPSMCAYSCPGPLVNSMQHRFLISFPYRLALSHYHGLFFRYLTWSVSFFLL